MHYLPRELKIALLGLVPRMLLASIFEVFSLGAVVPFLIAITEPSVLLDYEILGASLEKIGVGSAEGVKYLMAGIFVFVMIGSGMARYNAFREKILLSYRIGTALSSCAFDNAQYQPFELQVLRKPSEILALLMNKVSVVVGSGIIPALTLVGSAITVTFIGTTLLLIDWASCLALIFIIAPFYLIVSRTTKKRVRDLGVQVNKAQAGAAQTITETFGGIREVKLLDLHDRYSNRFYESDLALRKGAGSIQLVSVRPRFILEVLAASSLAVVALYWSVIDKSDEIVPILGAIALGAQRLIPSVQSLFSSLSSMRGSVDACNELVAMLRTQENTDHKSRSPSDNSSLVWEEAKLKNVCYRPYSTGRYILRDVNITISRTDRIALIGQNGSGKSTLLDLFITLHRPTSGNILVDGNSLLEKGYLDWRKSIAYVSQKSYIFNESIEENMVIADSGREFDNFRATSVFRSLGIQNLIDERGLTSSFGERATSLSGGQRQRFALARALYSGVNFYLFDEITNAIDPEGVKLVLSMLSELPHEAGYICVSHSPEILALCNRYLLISDEMVTEVSESEARDFFKNAKAHID